MRGVHSILSSSDYESEDSLEEIKRNAAEGEAAAEEWDRVAANAGMTGEEMRAVFEAAERAARRRVDEWFASNGLPPVGWTESVDAQILCPRIDKK